MKRITLPVLDENASASEAWDALRRHGARGVVGRIGAACWLYDADAIVNAVRRDKSLTLREVPGREIPVFAPDPRPDIKLLRNFLNVHVYEPVVIRAVDRTFGPGVMTLFARDSSPVAQVEAKAWRCPDDPSEVFTRPGSCNVHGKVLIQDA